MSSHRLSFLGKLIICRGLKFSLPQNVSPIDLQASFERTYWKIEPLLEENDKELPASSTLRSAYSAYQPQSPHPPKTLVKTLNGLKKRDDIVITKPDKGSRVVVMDKTEYIPPLRAASVGNTSKFNPLDNRLPKTRGRPPKHFHPLLQKKKELRTTLHEILP